MPREYIITAFWDDEAAVWVASSDDVPGLITEASSMDALVDKLKAMIPELLELNGIIKGGGPSVPFQLKAHVDGAPNSH